MGEHTPGTWSIYEYGDEETPALVIHKDSENRVCFMATPGSRGDPEKIEADAKLICAAPDLLSALKEAIEFQNDDTECCLLGDGRYEVCPDARCKAHGCMVARVNRWRAVVAKAEGKSNG